MLRARVRDLHLRSRKAVKSWSVLISPEASGTPTKMGFFLGLGAPQRALHAFLEACAPRVLGAFLSLPSKTWTPRRGRSTRTRDQPWGTKKTEGKPKKTSDAHDGMKSALIIIKSLHRRGVPWIMHTPSFVYPLQNLCFFVNCSDLLVFTSYRWTHVASVPRAEECTTPRIIVVSGRGTGKIEHDVAKVPTSLARRSTTVCPPTRTFENVFGETQLGSSPTVLEFPEVVTKTLDARSRRSPLAENRALHCS